MTDFRAATLTGLNRLLDGDPAILAAGARIDMMAPVDRVTGAEGVMDAVVAPLRAALSGLQRRPEIVIGGDSNRAEGGRWVVTLGHLVGRFVAPLWGVAPSDRLAFLREGGFWRLDPQGRVIEARVILDLPDLMRQAGRAPFPAELGTEMLFPGPATHDGISPDPHGGADSLALIERMLGDLHDYDPETAGSKGQTGEGGTWADDFLWYGPGGVGSCYRWDGFVDHHRRPFLRAFPDRKGGNHYCRIGDGSYAAVSGWPSMTMTHRAPYLGIPETGKALTLRVMDFYRCAGGRIAENWVLLDYVDLCRQMGRDILR